MNWTTLEPGSPEWLLWQHDQRAGVAREEERLQDEWAKKVLKRRLRLEYWNGFCHGALTSTAAIVALFVWYGW